MKTWVKVSLGCVAVLLGVPILLAVALWRMNETMCGNKILADVSAPDKQTRAVVFRRDCGVKTGFSTQVSILRGTDSLPNDPGNVFVADRLSTEALARARRVDVRWRSAARLDVRYDARLRINVSDTLVEGIKIRFVPVRPDVNQDAR